ncbi:14093_t:CDS:2, partial [Racocetra fulgida]
SEQLVFVDESAKDKRSIIRGYGYSQINTRAAKKVVFVREYLNAFGVCVEFLPAYSPDLNPIETAFSVIKNYLQRYRYFVESSHDPKYPLLVAYTQILPEMAKKFYEASGYK